MPETNFIISQFNQLTPGECYKMAKSLGINYDESRPKSEFIYKIIHSDHTIEKIAIIFGQIGRPDIQHSLRYSSLFHRPISQLFLSKDADTTSSDSSNMKTVMEHINSLWLTIGEMGKVVTEQANRITEQANRIQTLEERPASVEQGSDVHPPIFEMASSESSSNLIDQATILSLSTVLDESIYLLLQVTLEAKTGKLFGKGSKNTKELLTKLSDERITRSQLRDTIYTAYNTVTDLYLRGNAGKEQYKALKDQLQNAIGILG